MPRWPTTACNQPVRRSVYEGPRVFIAGQPISQAGGHADIRPRGVRGGEGYFCSCAGMGLIGAIADGVGEVRRPVQCVPVVFGTDLLGHMHCRQDGEFAPLAAAMPPVEVLQSATTTAAQPMRHEGQNGQLVPGARADLLVVGGDPTQDLAPPAKPETGIRLAMQGGRVVLNRLAA